MLYFFKDGGDGERRAFLLEGVGKFIFVFRFGQFDDGAIGVAVVVSLASEGSEECAEGEADDGGEEGAEEM